MLGTGLSDATRAAVNLPCFLRASCQDEGRLPGRLYRLPQGSMWRERPSKGRLTVNCEVKRLTLPGAALAALKPGTPSTSFPPVRRDAAAGGRRPRDAQPRFTLPHRMREIRVIPRLMWRFGKSSNHNGEGSTL